MMHVACAMYVAYLMHVTCVIGNICDLCRMCEACLSVYRWMAIACGVRSHVDAVACDWRSRVICDRI